MKNITQLSFVIVLAVVCLNAGAEAPIAALDDSQVTPAEALKMMQGKWKVSSVYLPSLSDDGMLPKELGFTQQGSEIVVKGNSFLSNGKLVATFANDIDLPHQQEELGFKRWHLLLLTLPTGKAVLCSYDLSGDRMEIAYTHKCSCHRGSGHILALTRTTK